MHAKKHDNDKHTHAIKSNVLLHLSELSICLNGSVVDLSRYPLVPKIFQTDDRYRPLP